MRRYAFTLIELLVVIAIIAILAAILFPVFARAREKARQSTCSSNQRQIAASIQMYVQDHDETLPAAASVWQNINIDAGVLVCPTLGKSTPNGYGYFTQVAGLAIGKIDDPASKPLTMDSSASDNLVVTPADIDQRHTKNEIMSFADGHVAPSTDTVALFTANTDMFANAVTLTANEMGCGGNYLTDIHRGVDWLDQGNGWTTYLNPNTNPGAGFMTANGGTSGSGHHWIGIYLTKNGPTLGGAAYGGSVATAGTKTLWIRSWESLVTSPNYFKRALTADTTNYTLHSNVVMWIMECDFGWCPNNTPATCAGNWESKLKVADSSGSDIANFHWFVDDNGYTGDDGSGYFKLNGYSFESPRPTPYASNPANTWQAPLFAALWPLRHMKIVCCNGTLYFTYGSLSCTTAATGNWQNPGYLYGETWHYNPAGWTVVQNLKYSEVLTRQ